MGKITDSKTFCPHLWLGAVHSNGGFFKPCCQYQVKDLENKWGKGFQSNFGYHNSDRLEISQGKKPQGCENCWQNESNGLHSLRTETLDLDWWHPYQTQINALTGPDGSFDHQPVYFDLKLGNKCNLACRMCSPESSSLIEKEVREHRSLFDYHPHTVTDLDFVTKHFTDDSKIDMVFDAIKQVKGPVEIKFTGGEPFLNKRIPEFVDHCISTGVAGDIKIHFTSNLTHLPDQLLIKLKQFKWCGISISMEGIEDIYEYIRYPAKWSKFEKNLDLIKQSNIWYTFCYTATALSILGFADWLKWVKDQSIVWDFNPVLGPNFLQIKNIPQPLKDQIIQTLNDIKPQMINKNSVIDGCIKMMSQTCDDALWHTLVKDTQVKDQLRGQSIHKSIPKLAVFMPVDRS